MAHAHDHLSEIGSSIPPVNPEVLTLKRGAFLAQLLMKEVDLGESTPSGSHDHTPFSMWETNGLLLGGKPSPNNMPVSWYEVQGLQRVLWAKGEGIERRTRLNLLKRT